MLKFASPNERGFSLVEMVIVVAIIGILLAIASIFGKPWIDKYNAEGQIRQMHADLLQARMKAMEKNKQYFVVVNTSSYQVIEDTNENGTIDVSPTDTYLPLVPLKYSVITGGTITMDQRGLVSADTYTTIQFNTLSGKPEYNCISWNQTRITIGSMNGTNCIPR